MDRVNVSFAALQMNSDLRFSATVYGIGAGAFYLAYALFEFPSNMLLTRVGARRWLARILFTWGFLAAGYDVRPNRPPILCMRFLLGMAEAGFFPGVVYYLVPLVSPPAARPGDSRFYFFGLLSATIMGAASTVACLHGPAGLSGWQWLFLAEGLPAGFVGIAIFLFLPDSPTVGGAGWRRPQKGWIARNLAPYTARMPPGFDEPRGRARPSGDRFASACSACCRSVRW